MVLDAEHVRADALAAMGKAIAITLQAPVLQDNLVVAVGTALRFINDHRVGNT